MTDSTLHVPEPLSTDSDDVSDALDVAQSLWENGKRTDAIHWMKRAVDSAKKGDPSRVAFLARTVEELERALTAPPPVAPPAPTPRSVAPPPVSVSRPPPPPVPKISKPPPPPAAKLSKPPPPAPAQAKERAPQAPPATTHAIKTSPSDQTLRVRATMRVSVKTSVRDETLLVVRPLADGAEVPPGTREALLTFVNDDTDAGAAR